MNRLDFDQLLTRLRRGHTLAEWLFMTEGTRINRSKIFRQNKPVYERLCIHLGIPEQGTKQHLLERLLSHEFSTAEMDELKQFKTDQKTAAKREHERERDRKTFEKVAAGPRPYEFITYYALTQYDARVAAYDGVDAV